MTTVEFSFEVLYDAQKIGIESLFVMVFGNLEEPDSPLRLWVYLDRYMVNIRTLKIVMVANIIHKRSLFFFSSMYPTVPWRRRSVLA